MTWEVCSSELSSSGATVTSSNPDSGSPFNALWKDGNGETTGTHFWNIKINKLAGDVFVGITDQEKFKQGWEFKGLTFGGNLSNGGALLVSSFGPWPREADTVGILLKREGNIKVYLFFNGRPLGLAFDVPDTTLGPAFPTVCFSGKGEVIIKKEATIPENIEFKEEVFEGLEGHWKLDYNNFSENNKRPIELPADISPEDMPLISLKLTKISENGADVAEAYQAHMSVINQINFRLHKMTSGKWTTSAQATTRMMGDPLEDKLLELTQDPSEVSESADVLTINKDSAKLKSTWTRKSTKKEPVTTNPFE